MSLLIGSALQAIISVVSMGFKEVSYPLTPMSRFEDYPIFSAKYH